ncbi:MAG TPA: hypothetical protein PLJ27_12650 [Polyangiaceae bacterium]|nr:hypothetical protein [Polyangiaceae bacterium]HNZ23315.1 hypothetical protein [Polyangiaceae bacterium]HOD21915.1 hypothetical protein [Polyangiaceae bacterium]HOE49360.1 hypothetical protein [Polyangiaceae bacterium]HOH00947.1 hypothetical protein [Polyangiaceae bacterium]
MTQHLGSRFLFRVDGMETVGLRWEDRTLALGSDSHPPWFGYP